MKDYTLSEVKAMCESRETCVDCPLMIVTSRGIGCLFWIMPLKWQKDIEHRDMIELPFKECCEHEERGGGFYKTWRVYYRGYAGYIAMKQFLDECEADAFIAELKGTKRG